MSQNHLSDEQIQNYLDNPAIEWKKEISDHLKFCPQCRQNFTYYRQLFQELDRDTVPALSVNFASNVIAALVASGEKRRQSFESGLIIAFFMIGIAVSLYFINPLALVGSTGNQLVSLFSGYLGQLSPYLSGNLPFIAIAVLIFLLVELFDKKILRPR